MTDFVTEKMMDEMKETFEKCLRELIKEKFRLELPLSSERRYEIERIDEVFDFLINYIVDEKVKLASKGLAYVA